MKKFELSQHLGIELSDAEFDMVVLCTPAQLGQVRVSVLRAQQKWQKQTGLMATAEKVVECRHQVLGTLMAEMFGGVEEGLAARGCTSVAGDGEYINRGERMDFADLCDRKRSCG